MNIDMIMTQSEIKQAIDLMTAELESQLIKVCIEGENKDKMIQLIAKYKEVSNKIDSNDKCPQK